MNEQPPVSDQDRQPSTRRRVPWWACALACCGCGIIAVPILAAILLPVFIRARDKATQVGCMTNLRQYGLALALYSSDSDDRLPNAKGWMDACATYRISGIRCPIVARLDPVGYGYAFYSGLSRKPLKEIARPMEAVDVFESTNLSRNASDTGSSLPVPGRHFGRSNLLYLDGHVKSWESSEIRLGAPSAAGEAGENEGKESEGGESEGHEREGDAKSAGD
jgi:prepilin-type processing-associated H-X9-DG protein